MTPEHPTELRKNKRITRREPAKDLVGLINPFRWKSIISDNLNNTSMGKPKQKEEEVTLNK